MYHRVVKAKDNILIFGGSIDGHSLDDIHRYNILENEWKTLNVKLPVPLDAFGCTAVMNEQYVIILCGSSSDQESSMKKSDDIYIYSVDDQTITKSSIKCPVQRDCLSVTMCDQKRNEMTVIGYVREQWKLTEIPMNVATKRSIVTHQYILFRGVYSFVWYKWQTISDQCICYHEY